jgi:mono/diheme cytochrome c family protein
LKKLSSKSDRTELIQIPLHGKKGKVVVNGKEYDGEMPAFTDITDAELAEVLTYVTSHFGNSAKKFTADEVKKARTAKIAKK